MSGHSKWAQIKRQKGATDARRGQLFTKLTREIIVATRQGGSSPESNFRLRLAVQKARDNNMPLDNIDRAIKKGSGLSEAGSLTELTLEGYGAHGVAIMVEALTDNRNRTIADVRSVFTKHGGNLGESGCVSWIFDQKGYISVSAETTDEETLMEVALEAGADDILEDNDEKLFEVYTSPEDFIAVKEALDAKGIAYESAEITMIPKNPVKLSGKEAEQALRLMDSMEDNDDVQQVYANFDISKEVMESLN